MSQITYWYLLIVTRGFKGARQWAILHASTMPAKSLGTLAMIYDIDELQNPLPRKTMLCGGDMNNPACRSDAFLHSYGFRLATQLCLMGGGGLHSHS